MSGVEMSGPPPVNPEEVRAILVDEGHRAMVTSTHLLHAEVLSRMERHRRTGTQMRATYSHVTTSGVAIVGIVGNPLDYTRWLEEGTGLYGPRNQVIRPTHARALRFPEPGNAGFTLAGRQRSGRAGAGARWVFAKYVRGVRPLRMFRDSSIVVLPKVEATFAAHGRRAAARIQALWLGGSR